jgi:hypothetical protein
MAKRTETPLHADKTKKLIQASQLINRLILHANGKCDMSATQVNAAKIVIGKVIPDLKAIEVTGEGGGAVKFEVLAPWLTSNIADRNKG